MLTSLASALGGWHGTTAERKLSGLLLPAGRRRAALRASARSLERWLSFAALASVRRAQALGCRRHATLSAQARALRHWCAVALRSLSAALDSASVGATSRARVGLITLALAVWREVADVRSVSQTILNASFAAARYRAKCIALLLWRRSIVANLRAALDSAQAGAAEAVRSHFATWREVRARTRGAPRRRLAHALAHLRRRSQLALFAREQAVGATLHAAVTGAAGALVTLRRHAALRAVFCGWRLSAPVT